MILVRLEGKERLCNVLMNFEFRQCNMTFITACNGKVMFLHLSVTLFTGGVSVQEGLCPEGISVQGFSVQGVSVQGVSVQGDLCLGVSVQGESLSGRPPPVRLCAGGAHPTGMHFVGTG